MAIRYTPKTRDAPARYEIDVAEAEVVQLVYDNTPGRA